MERFIGRFKVNRDRAGFLNDFIASHPVVVQLAGNPAATNRHLSTVGIAENCSSDNTVVIMHSNYLKQTEIKKEVSREHVNKSKKERLISP
jgi:hypothetical protein